MSRIPARFDLWVRKARESTDPARQVDWVLGGLLALEALYFLNRGTKDLPEVSEVTLGAPGESFALIFTDAQRLEEFVAARRDLLPQPWSDRELPVIASPTQAALAWCVERDVGLLINPEVGETVTVTAAALAAFVHEWKQRGGPQSAGFWIPNLTSEEEDFWQENGL